MLLVEDREEDVELLCIAFEQAGIPQGGDGLEVIADGASAKRRIEEAASGAKPLPALILLDLNLPFVSGTELLKLIRRQWSADELPVFIVTTSSDPRMRERCLKLGADAYFVKPDSMAGYQSLMEAVRGVVG